MIGTKLILILAIQGISANYNYQNYPVTATDANTSVYATSTDPTAYDTTTASAYPTDSYDTTTTLIAYTTDGADTDISAYPTGSTATDSSSYPTDSTYTDGSDYSTGSTTTNSSDYPTGSETTTTDSPSSLPTDTSSSCSGSNYSKVNITSPSNISTSKDFTISWTSPQPDPSKNHTEARVELWALNAGPVNSPLLAYKSDRLFDTSNYTYNFPASYLNSTTKGGPIIWQLYVGVYSTYFSSNVTDLESWNLPYYGLQKVKFE